MQYVVITVSTYFGAETRRDRRFDGVQYVVITVSTLSAPEPRRVGFL